jgi:hypothetical protein
MIKIVIIIILLFAIYIINNYEYFDNTFNPNSPQAIINNIDNYQRISLPDTTINTNSIYQNRVNLIPTTINDSTLSNNNSLINFNYTQLNQEKNSKCCLIKKVLDNNNFKYIYEEYKDDECDINNFNLDQNNQLFIDGINNWSNDLCKTNDKIGSCVHYNFECIDFVDEKTCTLYNDKIGVDIKNRKIQVKWNPKPCYNKNNNLS